MKRVLVSGAGSGVGQGIMKALSLSKLDLQIIAADVGPLNPGLYRGHESISIPKVEDGEALQTVRQILVDRAIDLVLPGSEFDLQFFADHRNNLEEETGTLISVANPEAVRTCNDKWLTFQLLSNNGVQCPDSIASTDSESLSGLVRRVGFPLIVKPRIGTSSRGQFVVLSEDQLWESVAKVKNPVIQEFVSSSQGGIGGEYTCSFFRTRGGDVVGPFIARRTLKAGTSWTLEVAPFTELHEYLRGIAELVEFEGSLNIQLIVGPKGPVTLELNCRFSGTTAVRAHFGFNEPEMAISTLLLGRTLLSPEIRSGVVLRYVEEVFIDGLSIDELVPGRDVGQIHQWF